MLPAPKAGRRSRWPALFALTHAGPVSGLLPVFMLQPVQYPVAMIRAHRHWRYGCLRAREPLTQMPLGTGQRCLPEAQTRDRAGAGSC